MKQLGTNKNYLILVIGQVIALFGSAIQRFALSLYEINNGNCVIIFDKS